MDAMFVHDAAALAGEREAAARARHLPRAHWQRLLWLWHKRKRANASVVRPSAFSRATPAPALCHAAAVDPSLFTWHQGAVVVVTDGPAKGHTIMDQGMVA